MKTNNGSHQSPGNAFVSFQIFSLIFFVLFITSLNSAFRCENPPMFENVDASPTFTNFTYFEYEATVFYKCRSDMVLDPHDWDSNLTIACVGNQTWGVINYAGATHDWLPTECRGNQRWIAKGWECFTFYISEYSVYNQCISFYFVFPFFCIPFSFFILYLLFWESTATDLLVVLPGTEQS